MILTNVRDTIHADSLALFEVNIYIHFARRCHQARKVEYFYFDLTCDVTVDPEVITLFSVNSFSRAFKCRLNF